MMHTILNGSPSIQNSHDTASCFHFQSTRRKFLMTKSRALICFGIIFTVKPQLCLFSKFQSLQTGGENVNQYSNRNRSIYNFSLRFLYICDADKTAAKVLKLQLEVIYLNSLALLCLFKNVSLLISCGSLVIWVPNSIAFRLPHSKTVKSYFYFMQSLFYGSRRDMIVDNGKLSVYFSRHIQCQRWSNFMPLTF